MLGQEKIIGASGDVNFGVLVLALDGDGCFDRCSFVTGRGTEKTLEGPDWNAGTHALSHRPAPDSLTLGTAESGTFRSEDHVYARAARGGRRRRAVHVSSWFRRGAHIGRMPEYAPKLVRGQTALRSTESTVTDR